MELISQIITSVTSIVAIIIAVISLRMEGKRNRFTLGVQVLMEFSKSFNSPEFKTARRKTVQLMTDLLYKSRTTGNPIVFDSQNYFGAAEVIDFFQELGAMTRNKVISIETVWNDYSYWISHYWAFFRDAVYLERSEGFEQYATDFEWLVVKFNEKKFKRFNPEVDFDSFISYELTYTES